MSKTQYNIPFCKGEGYLSRACNMSVDLSQDIDFARNAVASRSKSTENASDELEAIAPLTKTVREELGSCLGRIASGDCSHYPYEVAEEIDTTFSATPFVGDGESDDETHRTIEITRNAALLDNRLTKNRADVSSTSYKLVSVRSRK